MSATKGARGFVNADNRWQIGGGGSGKYWQSPAGGFHLAVFHPYQCFYEALQVIVYIWLPTGINFEITLKGLNYPDGLPLTQNPTKIKSGTSHIMHQTSHIAYCIRIFIFYKILIIEKSSNLPEINKNDWQKFSFSVLPVSFMEIHNWQIILN